MNFILQEVEADHVQLEVIVLTAVQHLLAIVQPHHGVERQLETVLLLPALQLLRLFHPGRENATHAGHDGLAQLVRLAAVIVQPPVGLAETPHGNRAVDAVPDVSEVGWLRGGGEEVAGRALVAQQLPLH